MYPYLVNLNFGYDVPMIILTFGYGKDVGEMAGIMPISSIIICFVLWLGFLCDSASEKLEDGVDLLNF